MTVYKIKHRDEFDFRLVTWGVVALTGAYILVPPVLRSEPVQKTINAVGVAASAISSGQNPITAIANSGKLEPKWSSKKSPEFLQKVTKIANELGGDPNHLMAIMHFESKLNHQAINPLSNATGLIQFMPFTARRLGTSTSALLAMTEIQQLDYVRKYLIPYKGKLNTLGDFYCSVLWPACVGSSESYVLFRVGTIQYRQNNGFDRNRDGVITKSEITALVSERL
ncbi:lytic transglycosylase domain-containing protein [Kamptonema sp. UHCC 0994]|uniref:lytic transglycosylase domain-containing protein n=1 Tax=Kamptonema sp. UHCC 0994 TaxID=3031329 RepID=UPI0023BAF0F4|nr:lytic transglycosylase domain-containing protein [Kamptonema sp. UHCC 0994]MDF0556564.1 lytic transglycosylase domain-containing protein [Kamptonema sp. UHCC 0994]